jgi:hypothetical protein
MSRGVLAARARARYRAPMSGCSSSCTSPQVERRDPLGVGLRPGCGVCRVAGKTARDKPSVARPAARRYAQGIRPHYSRCVETVASARHGTRRYGLRAVPGPGPLLVTVRYTFDRPANVSRGLAGDRYRSATLLLWVLLGPVLKHGPRSLTCTRVIGTCRET